MRIHPDFSYFFQVWELRYYIPLLINIFYLIGDILRCSFLSKKTSYGMDRVLLIWVFEIKFKTKELKSIICVDLNVNGFLFIKKVKIVNQYDQPLCH